MIHTKKKLKHHPILKWAIYIGNHCKHCVGLGGNKDF